MKLSLKILILLIFISIINLHKLNAEEKIKIGLLIPLSGNQSNVGKSILQTATEYFIRYNGTYDYLKDTTVHVKTIRIGNPNGSGRLENRPTCPFCEESMQSLSLSGKRKDKVETRFKCVSDHRISLFMGSTRSEMGWR